MSNSNPRRNKGRKKIEMKKMTNERNLQVTFSKRRSGLFKKASELCTLCGASVAIIVFSPGEKALSFGHPNVEAVINRYQMMAPAQNYSGLGVMQFIEAHRNANVCELNAHLTQVNADLEIEKSHNNELNKSRKEAQEKFWCATPIEDMTNAQLEQYKLALEDLKTRVTSHVGNQVVIQGANPNPPPQFFGGGSSSNNPPLVPHQPPFPPLPQLFPVPPPQMLQNPPLMMPNHMLNGVPMMMNHPGFNNMGGYGPPGGFF